MNMKNLILIILLWSTSSTMELMAQHENHSQTSAAMYLERNVFYLKFGASREAVPMWKDYLKRVSERDPAIHARLLTDVSGPAYTLILELTYQTFEEAEPSQCRLTNQSDWKEFYQKFIPYCDKAERTYYRIQADF
jgi:hypothetical protein